MSTETAPAEFRLSPQSRRIFVGLLLGMLIASISQTIVGPAMPRIVAELGGMEHYSWVATAACSFSSLVAGLAGAGVGATLGGATGGAAATTGGLTSGVVGFAGWAAFTGAGAGATVLGAIGFTGAGLAAAVTMGLGAGLPTGAG